MVKEKGGFLTPKAIGNRIKAKGLQKLRWYCQMCEKQCRDENGFKCHTMSESHQRQLLLVAENPHQFVSSFSQEFKTTFLDTLKRRFGTKRVQANVVYQEYISDKHHLHMNATQWTTLTGFVRWLGKHGHCHVDHTEKGWFMTYIDRDPETIRKMEAIKKKEKMDVDDTELSFKIIEKQIALDKNKDENDPLESQLDDLPSTETTVNTNDAHELKRGIEPEKEGEKIKISFTKTKSDQAYDKITITSLAKMISKKIPADIKDNKHDKPKEIVGGKRKRVEETFQQPKLSWIVPGIVIKIILRPDSGRPPYKATVKSVKHEKIRLPPTVTHKGGNTSYKTVLDLKITNHQDNKGDGAAQIKLYDYDEFPKVETVIPALGRYVIIVSESKANPKDGHVKNYVGEVGILKDISQNDFSALVELTIDDAGAKSVLKLPYDCVSKLDESEFGLQSSATAKRKN